MRVTFPAALLSVAVLLRGTGYFESSALRLAWIFAGVLCLVSLRWGAAVVAVMTWGILFFDHPANHLFFLAWAATTFAVFADTEQRRLLIRWQLTIVYAFTAISKLTPAWLSGDPLARLLLDAHGLALPPALLVVSAIGAAAAEAFLAPALWVRRLRPYVLAVGASAHLAFWLGAAPPIQNAWALLMFNGLAFGLLAWSTATRSPTRVHPPPPDRGAPVSERPPLGRRIWLHLLS
jgi:hypothetical protein